jgi:UDP-N-acetylmuramyl pentapeptide phosphotransferase/UDP-N-acetylglucosamine-1-phosphate transferase
MNGFCIALACFGLTLLASSLAGSCVWRWLAARQVMDAPTARSSHVRPTVRGGGLAIHGAIAAGLLGLAALLDARALLLLPPLLLLSAISFWDDLKGVSALARLGAHLLAAVVALGLLGWPVLTFAIPFVHPFMLPTAVSLALCGLWIAGMVNTYNFMDGINGHATFQTVITATASALLLPVSGGCGWLLPLMYLVVAGAAAGFLPHNFPQARMFMGDVGSVPLGAGLAILALWSARDVGGEVLVPLALLQFNFILDTAVTLAGRAWRRQRLSEPHREHLYERLALATDSHARVICLEMPVLLCVAVLLLCYPLAGAGLKLGIILAVIAVWLAYYLLADNYCRRKGFGVPQA